MTEQYSLKDTNVYKDTWDISFNVARDHYRHLMNEYIKYVIDNGNNFTTQDPVMYKYIVNRGLDTITHIFKLIMIHTNNIDATLFHSQKGILLYIEFVTQITQNANVFLKLNVRDAIVYVYKKTIFTLKERMTDTHCNIELNNITKMIEGCKYIVQKEICQDKLPRLNQTTLDVIQDTLNTTDFENTN